MKSILRAGNFSAVSRSRSSTPPPSLSISRCTLVDYSFIFAFLRGDLLKQVETLLIHTVGQSKPCANCTFPRVARKASNYCCWRYFKCNRMVPPEAFPLWRRGLFLLSPTILSNGLSAPHLLVIIVAIIVQTTVGKVN